MDNSLAEKIALKKKQIEELKKKADQATHQPKQATPSPIHQTPPAQQQEVQSTPQKNEQAPANKNEHFLHLYLENRRKKLQLYQTDEIKVGNDEKVSFEFGVQCEIQRNSSRKTSKIIQEEDAPLPRIDRQSFVGTQIPNFQTPAQAVPEKKEISLSNDQISSIIKSQTFNSFFNKSSKIIEKALAEDDFPILEDIIAQNEMQAKDDVPLLVPTVNFFDQQYSQNRVITSLNLSNNVADLIMASYGLNEEATINDQVGVILIWSLSLKTRPEFQCFCQSSVTTAQFYPFNNHMVLGGLYNGQVAIWDLRSKQTPEKRSTLQSGGHSCPIYCISVVGSQNSHNIVTVSNDGKACVWSWNMLNTPTKVLELKTKSKYPGLTSQNNQQSQLMEVNATSMEFPQSDANFFYVGSYCGSIYQNQLHSNQTTQEGVVTTFDEHSAPVTGISINHSSAFPLLNNLLLSSSMDWSVKLWNTRKQKDQCITTFESSEDYVMDVKWNPVNPSIFATGDAEGFVDIWDLTKDQEAPIFHYKLGANGINKLIWTSDGTKLFVGDCAGNLNGLQMEKKGLRIDNDRMNDFISGLNI